MLFYLEKVLLYFFDVHSKFSRAHPLNEFIALRISSEVPISAEVPISPEVQISPKLANYADFLAKKNSAMCSLCIILSKKDKYCRQNWFL
jgi:hypothetical protein